MLKLLLFCDNNERRCGVDDRLSVVCFVTTTNGSAEIDRIRGQRCLARIEPMLGEATGLESFFKG
jgi:hypothetical protein